MGKAITIKSIKITFDESDTAYQISADTIITSRFELFVPITAGAPVYIGDQNVDSTTYKGLGGTGDGTSAMQEYWASNHGDFTKGDYFDLSKLYVLSTTTGFDCYIVYYESV